jgi:fructosamine-3-kinase
MKELIQEIIDQELDDEIQSVKEIKGLGSVNTVYDIKGQNGNYIIRLNSTEKRIEYKKEKWCIEKIGKIGIPTVKILANGEKNGYCFMLQTKIPGINGNKCNSKEKAKIWLELGKYASKYQQIKSIEDEEFKKVSFHKDWKSRLNYNLRKLNKNDSLIKEGILRDFEQHYAKEVLKQLIGREFNTGLVHGDLCPRNVIMNKGKIYLLDWGTAEVNIVPHNEIGMLLMSNEASKEEFQFFLKGMKIKNEEFIRIEEEINILNFLHQLDIYRWAEGQGISKINDYPLKVKKTFNKLKSV